MMFNFRIHQDTLFQVSPKPVFGSRSQVARWHRPSTSQWLVAAERQTVLLWKWTSNGQSWLSWDSPIQKLCLLLTPGPVDSYSGKTLHLLGAFCNLNWWWTFLTSKWEKLLFFRGSYSTTAVWKTMIWTLKDDSVNHKVPELSPIKCWKRNTTTAASHSWWFSCHARFATCRCGCIWVLFFERSRCDHPRSPILFCSWPLNHFKFPHLRSVPTFFVAGVARLHRPPPWMPPERWTEGLAAGSAGRVAVGRHVAAASGATSECRAHCAAQEADGQMAGFLRVDWKWLVF